MRKRKKPGFVAGEALVLGFGPEAGHAAALLVGVEPELEAYRIVDATDETDAGVGLSFHDAASLRRLPYRIDAGFGVVLLLSL